MKATSPVLVRLCAYVSLSCSLIAASFAESVQIASEGKALFPIVVNENADEMTRKAADDLARLLSEISGATFEVSQGDGKSGIVVGSVSDFPDLEKNGEFDPKDPMRNEEYRIRSHRDGINLIGATPLAARHAIWDLLSRFGYRQFFPGKNWEVIPKQASLTIDVDEKQAPAFALRKIWYQYGSYRPKEVLQDWTMKNRAGAGFELQTGHSFTGIIGRNKAVFKEHPEYLALVKGNRWPMTSKLAKFCISNPDLQKLIVEDSLKRMKEPATPPSSISIDPSDGGYWCECEECAKLGSITDQQVFLANLVAEAVTKEFPGTKIGMYAYYQHSQPPKIDVHPAIIVSVATQLTTGKLTGLKLARAWNEKGATIGTRDYYSIWTWNRSLPGGARAANPKALGKWIKEWSEVGSRFITAESADDWAPCGLGYYVAARTMWDLDESGRFDEIRADFLEKAFSSAKEPMSEFYRLIDGRTVPNSEDKMARMYRLLDNAYKATSDAAVRQRINDLSLYTRYMELYWAYNLAAGEERQAAYEEMLQYALRIKNTGMVASVAVHRDLPVRDKNIVVPEEHKWLNRRNSSWQQTEPHTEAEIAEIRANGIARNRLVSFDTVIYTTELVPASELGIPFPTTPMGMYHAMPRYKKTFYTWVPPGKKTVTFRSNASRTHRLYSVSADGNELMSEVDYTHEPAATRETESRDIVLQTTLTGLHQIEIDGGIGDCTISWDEGMPMTLVPESNQFSGAGTLYFYVPKGTTVIGGHTARRGRGIISDAHGNEVFSFQDVPEKGGHFEIPVPKGQDGTFWTLSKQNSVRFLSIPSLLARSPQELLLPKEVVEADAVK